MHFGSSAGSSQIGAFAGPAEAGPAAAAPRSRRRSARPEPARPEPARREPRRPTARGSRWPARTWRGRCRRATSRAALVACSYCDFRAWSSARCSAVSCSSWMPDRYCSVCQYWRRSSTSATIAVRAGDLDQASVVVGGVDERRLRAPRLGRQVDVLVDRHGAGLVLGAQAAELLLEPDLAQGEVGRGQRHAHQSFVAGRRRRTRACCWSSPCRRPGCRRARTSRAGCGPGAGRARTPGSCGSRPPGGRGRSRPRRRCRARPHGV